MNITFPNLLAGEIVDADKLNSNFADLVSGQHGLTTENLAARAGIVSSQLADRFAPWHCRANLGEANGADFASYVAYHQVPNTSSSPGSEVWRTYLTLRPGKLAYLVRVDIFLLYQDSLLDVHRPKVWVMKNGVVLGGGGKVIAAAGTRYSLGNANPYDDTLPSLADGDYLSIGLGHDASDTTVPKIGSLSVDFWGKLELGA